MSKNPAKINVNEAMNRLNQMTVNLLLSRSGLSNGLGLDVNPARNIDKECGYPETDPTLRDYRMMYERIGIATRAVQVYPEECWSVYPEIYEVENNRNTPWEKRWKEFEFESDPFHYLQRLDEQSRIGRFGGLLIGIDDGKELKASVEGIDKNGLPTKKRTTAHRNVLYMRPFAEDLIKVGTVEKDKSSPRFGQPTSYHISLSSPNTEPEGVFLEGEGSQGATVFEDVEVHWTRIHHQTDGLRSSDIFGTPILKNIYNYILDLRKISGAAPEMFWKGGFPGISFEALPELAAAGELDTESLKAEIEAYAQGLQRYMRLVGMTAKSLAPQVADPTNQLMSILQLICATLGVPLKTFLGSMLGHLASQEDSVWWRTRLRNRQNKYLTPRMIKPFVKRLMLMNVLPTVPIFITKWSDLNTLSDIDLAKVSLQKSQAILQYVTSGAYVFFPPKMFLVHVLNFTAEQADAIIKEAGGEQGILKKLEKMAEKANKGDTKAKSGTSPQKSSGAGGRRNGLGKAKK